MTNHSYVKTSGFQRSLFVENVIDELVCSICHGVLRDPVETVCEHIFCENCLKSQLVLHPFCPLDKKALVTHQFKKAHRTIRNIIDKLRLKCENHINGCNEILPIGRFDSHVAECQKASVLCPFQGCLFSHHPEQQTFNFSQNILLREQLDTHKQTCDFRVINCEACNEYVIFIQFEDHRHSRCPNTEITCPNGCGMKITRQLYTSGEHQHHCSMVEVDCIVPGCSKKVIKSEMENHLSQNLTTHFTQMVLLLNKLQKENNELQHQLSKGKVSHFLPSVPCFVPGCEVVSTVTQLNGVVTEVYQCHYIRILWNNSTFEKIDYTNPTINNLIINSKTPKELWAGARVYRGPNWKWENQDGGIGRFGTVLKSVKKGNWVYVRWDDADKENVYRWGIDENFDIAISKLLPDFLWIGAKVIRGPDWKWGDQDGGGGNIGTVTSQVTLDKWVEVLWENGEPFRYRWGANEFWDLKIISMGDTNDGNNYQTLTDSVRVLFEQRLNSVLNRRNMVFDNQNEENQKNSNDNNNYIEIYDDDDDDCDIDDDDDDEEEEEEEENCDDNDELIDDDEEEESNEEEDEEDDGNDDDEYGRQDDLGDDDNDESDNNSSDNGQNNNNNNNNNNNINNFFPTNYPQNFQYGFGRNGNNNFPNIF